MMIGKTHFLNYKKKKKKWGVESILLEEKNNLKESPLYGENLYPRFKKGE